jgi:hypothetical protein
MYPNFAKQYAPDVALPSYGEWDSPEPEPGLAPPEHLYDSRGTPLNYIQQEGGAREFLVPRGQAAFAAPPGPTTPQAPVRLRGRNQQAQDYPLGPNTDPQPQNILNPPPELVPEQRRHIPEVNTNIQPGVITERPTHGERVIIPVPSLGPSATSRPRTTEQPTAAPSSPMQAPGTRRNTQNNATIRDPQSPGGAVNSTERIQSEVNAGTAGGTNTLQRLLEEQGFNLSNFLARFRGRAPDAPGRRSASSAATEDATRPIANPHADLSMIDSPTNATPVSANRRANGWNGHIWNGQVSYVGPNEQVGRAEEVAAMLVANNIRVNSVYRENNAVPGGHDARNSIDVDPRDRDRAIALIGQYYPGLASESFDIEAGRRFGRDVRSTGHHGHIDLGPVAGPRRARRPQ